jgi:hypothetical protein
VACPASGKGVLAFGSKKRTITAARTCSSIPAEHRIPASAMKDLLRYFLIRPTSWVPTKRITNTILPLSCCRLTKFASLSGTSRTTRIRPCICIPSSHGHSPVLAQRGQTLDHPSGYRPWNRDYLGLPSAGRPFHHSRLHREFANRHMTCKVLLFNLAGKLYVPAWS